MSRRKIFDVLAIFILVMPLFLYTIYSIRKEQISYFPLEEISFLTGENNSQEITLWHNENDGRYYVFLPSGETEISLQLPPESRLKLNREMYDDGDYITNIEPGEAVEVSLCTEDNHVMSSGEVIFLQNDSIATMFVTAPKYFTTDQLVEGKEDKVKVNIDLYDSTGKWELSSDCTLKGRGNSSWDAEKKPYSLLFDKDVSMLGMKEQKKWALITNGADNSFLRDKIAYTLAEEAGCRFTPQAEYVNVYVNGSFQGIYLLTQRISEKNGCLKWDDNEQNFLFEIDERYAEENDWFMTENYGIVYSSNKPVNVRQISEMEARFERMLEVFEGKSIPEEQYMENCKQYIDVPSWVKQYMIGEFFVNVDLDYASQYFFSEGENPVLYAGPIWDYDNSMGIFSTMSCYDISPYLQWAEGREGSWFAKLMQHEAFREMYVDYYENTFSKLITDMIENKIPSYVEQMDTSMYMDSIRWSSGADCFSDEVKQIINWLSERKQFYDDYWKNRNDYVKVTFVENLGKDYVYCMKKGEKLEQYPQSYLYGDTVWTDEAGNEIPVGTYIAEDVRLYPVYK